MTYKEMYDEMLNECSECPDEVMGIAIIPAEFLEKNDPIAYRCGFSDWSSDVELTCDCCGCEFRPDDCDMDEELADTCPDCLEEQEEEEEEEEEEPEYDGCADPTADEMRKFLHEDIETPTDTDETFSIEAAIYWFATDWHSGQSSNLYSALSTSQYKPGMTESAPDCISQDYYDALEEEYCF